MTEQKRQGSPAVSATRDTQPALCSKNAPPDTLSGNTLNQELQTQHENQVRDLQQYICELLIKNQRLRWLLELVKNHQREGIPDDHDQNIATN